ncbi:MAG: 4Fe-4S binding protein [Spirochaetales bacterium]|nr:4Fe-4S binding protein [Spirochaetales bacterium]
MKSKSKLQLIRNAVQLVFLVLLIAGIYTKMRMVLIVFLPAALLFGNFFCGWACPYGTVQEIFGKIGSLFIKKKLKMPRVVQKYLQYVRYILFALVTVGIGEAAFYYINGYMTFMGQFMAGFILDASFVIMISFALIALFFERPFCNYLCTEAAKYGIVSMVRIFSIKRNEDTCISCRKCDRVCPMNIVISDKKHVRNGQCINCLECVSACPVENTLTYGFTGLKLRNK